MTKIDNPPDFIPLDEAPIIDSFKIRIPLALVDIIDDRINTTWLKVADDGEVLEEGKENKKLYEEDGIKTRFGIEAQRDHEGRVYDYLTILINSKTLKSQYFDGITDDNIDLVYEYLMSLKCVEFSLTTFLKGECTDVDYKQDGRTDIDTYNRAKRQYASSTKLSKYKDDGIRTFNKKDNSGVQWSDRRTKKYMTNPYLKFYHKEIELTFNSSVFYKKYLNPRDAKDRVRMETTVKNKTHFRRLGIDNTSLSSLLSLTNDQRLHIMRKAMSAHLEPRIHEIKNHSEMKPNQRLIYNAVVSMMMSGKTYQLVRDQLLSNFEDKVAKSRKASELDELHRVWIKGADVEQETELLNALLDFYQSP